MNNTQRRQFLATQLCIPFALAASTVAMLIGVEEGKKRESSKTAKETRNIEQHHQTVNPGVRNREIDDPDKANTYGTVLMDANFAAAVET